MEGTEFFASKSLPASAFPRSIYVRLLQLFVEFAPADGYKLSPPSHCARPHNKIPAESGSPSLCTILNRPAPILHDLIINCCIQFLQEDSMQIIDRKTHLSQLRMRTTIYSLRIAWWIPAFLLVLFLAVPALAQFRTSIQGTVTDTTGAVIPGATLTLKNLATNETVVRTSNDGRHLQLQCSSRRPLQSGCRETMDSRRKF